MSVSDEGGGQVFLNEVSLLFHKLFQHLKRPLDRVILKICLGCSSHTFSPDIMSPSVVNVAMGCLSVKFSINDALVKCYFS